MARNRLADFMQNHRFWLMDVVPSATFPFLVLGTPFLGFQSITVPEYTFDVDEIKEVNSMFKKHVYSGGGVSNITLTRGVRGYDDTMWQWMIRAVKGNDTTNRNLLLIHYTSVSSGLASAAGFVANPLVDIADLPGDAWEGKAFLPGKAWLLWNVIPARYKPASDFDAMGGQVSVAEIELSIHAMTEMTLMSPL